MNEKIVFMALLIYYFSSGMVVLSASVSYLAKFFFKRIQWLDHRISAGLLLLCAFISYLNGSTGLQILFGITTAAMLGWAAFQRLRETINAEWPDLNQVLYVSLIICLILTALIIRLYGINSFGVRIDEPKHYKTVTSLLKTGELDLWNFVNDQPGRTYKRAGLYSYLVFAVVQVFNDITLSGRLVSLAFGILTVLPVLLIANQLGLGRLKKIFLVIWLTVSPYLVTISRWMRFYSFFTFVFLMSLWLILRFLKSSQFTSRLFYGLSVLLTVSITLHLQMIGVLIIPAILIYLAYEYIHIGKAPFAFRNIILLLVGSVSLIIFVISPLGSDLFFLSNSGDPAGEVGRIFSFYPFYGVYLLQPLFGFLLGGLFLGMVLTYGVTNPTDRYYFCSLFIPVFLVMLFTTRFPQIRFVGHFIPLAFILVLNALDTFMRALRNQESVYFSLMIVPLLVLFPVRDLNSRLRYIWQGNMGYVAFGYHQPSPDYRTMVNSLSKNMDSGDAALFYNLPDIYYPAFENRLARVSWVSRSRRPKPELTVDRLRRLEAKGERIWVVTLERFHGLSRETLSYLEDNYQTWNEDEISMINVYTLDRSDSLKGKPEQ